jgi:hypothetical protein
MFLMIVDGQELLKAERMTTPLYSEYKTDIITAFALITFPKRVFSSESYSTVPA